MSSRSESPASPAPASRDAPSEPFCTSSGAPATNALNHGRSPLSPAHVAVWSAHAKAWRRAAITPVMRPRSSVSMRLS